MELYGKLKQDVIDKLYHYCAYQERCKQDVRKKLEQLEIPKSYHAWYIKHLEEERFLNEECYVDSFVKSRVNGNKWGKRKIEFQLKQKGISEALINHGFEQLPKHLYSEILLALAEKKYKKVKGKTPWEKKQKVFAFLSQRGFEYDLIKDALSKFN